MKSDDEILEAGGTQEDIDNYAHDVGGACGAVYGGTCDHPGCKYKTHLSSEGEDALRALHMHGDRPLDKMVEWIALDTFRMRKTEVVEGIVKITVKTFQIKEV